MPATSFVWLQKNADERHERYQLLILPPKLHYIKPKVSSMPILLHIERIALSIFHTAQKILPKFGYIKPKVRTIPMLLPIPRNAMLEFHIIVLRHQVEVEWNRRNLSTSAPLSLTNVQKSCENTNWDWLNPKKIEKKIKNRKVQRQATGVFSRSTKKTDFEPR